MQCHNCGRLGPPEGNHTMFRVNQPGEVPAVWACRECRADPGPDTDGMEEIIRIIEDDGAEGGPGEETGP